MGTDWREVLAPSVQYVRLMWCDAAGIRRVVPRRKLEQASKTGVGMAYACMWLPAWGDSCIDDPAGVPVGEMRLVPDPTAAHVLPWMPSHAIALVTMCKQHEPWECCPRTVLKRVLAGAFQERGLTFQMGFELEFYLLRLPKEGEGGGSGGGGGLPPPLDTSNYCHSGSFDAAAPGPGQFEIATGPAPPLQAADSLLFSMEAVSAVARKHGLLASFLPKLRPREAASGRHCHVSVWRGDANLLRHEAPAAAAAAGAPAAPPRVFKLAGSGEPALPGLAPEGEAFLAGVLRHLPALTCFTSPSPNSFRRQAPHCWTGAYQCYGPNNREAALRLCSTPGVPDAANAELKACDASSNPHLAAAALIVAGLVGVEEGLNLPPPVELDPGNLTDSQRKAAGIRPLPATLGEALEAFEADREFQLALASAFGTPTLPRAFMAVRRSEWEHFREMPLEQEAAALYARY
ncbi:hypothetical protein CHLNCDRAFT_141615 [Chlorella variabilis]|uniref:GS catalytic domain-containing protein n=1 Tax=Chlorella variabilis TaxID=554065 RepID=E1ZT62_CHLVA|nr:hypothetical protein CHLNCDRAFT_141615 [Chlorella variabilis]EFN50945.1 hypothetical protein CHLNCDRAFT_141615 [Chlorella variabilis]|eukprot:XP_005843047.1 hypothetical protein CHLNCDRAFT_141615 [Chlorella variabilis]